jgi:hypothetical protein
LLRPVPHLAHAFVCNARARGTATAARRPFAVARVAPSHLYGAPARAMAATSTRDGEPLLSWRSSPTGLSYSLAPPSAGSGN